MLDGKEGYAVKKSMEILVALGEIFGAESLIEVGSVQVAGVSYHNLGDAGLEFLDELSKDGRVKVLTTLNPAGMDLEDWQQLRNQPRIRGKTIPRHKSFRKNGYSGQLHMYAISNWEPTAFWRALGVVRIISRNLCKLCYRR